MISITSQQNTVKKFGKPKDEIDHMKVKLFIYHKLKRVITKENTPVVP
jgi:hypothetical protein